MNKTAIKNFAIWARVQLMDAAIQRAYEYDITENGENKPGLAVAGGRPLSPLEIRQRDQLLVRIRQKGFRQVMEEAAYTWFNRFIALRFMEVNSYLPSQTRVFTDENGAFKPELLREAMRVELDGLSRETVMDLLDRRNDEALYKYLFITQCNALNKPLPGMFEKIADWTELLFPANLLRADSVVGRMLSDIPEEDWTDQVQIVGWLYQYYNAELKDETFAMLKKNTKITKERIPAATQLFTPDWIVRYMVENSLGRLWVEGHPDERLKANWKYYLEEAEQEPEVAARLAELRKERGRLQPEDIRFIDPCMGSGHILVYAFDVLMQVYLSQGWSERDAAQSIVEHNLYGLDIDERAAQLAYFAVMMKARQYDRRFFNRGIQPQVFCTKGDAEGPEFGSLLIVKDPGPRPEQQDLFSGNEDSWNYRNLLAQKYDVVCTNPPYMAVSNAGEKLQDYVKKNFPDSKNDLFACFIERCGQLAGKNGYQAMITQHAWMFLSSFEKLRVKLQAVDTVNMAHLGARAFEEIGGEVVQTTSFVMRRSHIKDYKGTYCRLIEPTTQQGKEDMFLAGGNRYTVQQDNFSKIPGSPVAYWAGNSMLDAFASGKEFGGEPKKGVLTGDNERFLRLWHEVFVNKIGFKMKSHIDMIVSRKKWFPVTSGGEKRKWYGNFDTIINLKNDGAEIKAVVKNYRLRDPKYYMIEAVTWTEVSSGAFSCRYVPSGILFGNGGPVSFFPHADLLYHLGLLNSNIAMEILRYLAPTINYGPEQINKIPVIEKDNEKIDKIVKENISLSRADWDSFETSWDFKKHPLM